MASGDLRWPAQGALRDIASTLGAILHQRLRHRTGERFGDALARNRTCNACKFAVHPHEKGPISARAQAVSTARAYRAGWTDFSRWGPRAGRAAKTTDAVLVALYLAHAAKRLKYTLALRRSAIGARLRTLGRPLNLQDPTLKDVWAGIVRTSAVGRTGFPQGRRRAQPIGRPVPFAYTANLIVVVPGITLDLIKRNAMSGHRQFEVFICVKANGRWYIDSVSQGFADAKGRAATVADVYRSTVRVVRSEYRPTTGLYHDQILFKFGNDHLFRRSNEWLTPHLRRLLRLRIVEMREAPPPQPVGWWAWLIGCFNRHAAA